MKNFTISTFFNQLTAICKCSSMKNSACGTINKNRYYLFSIILLLTLGTGNVWGAEDIYKTALFGTAYNSNSISSYTDSWSATNDGFTVDLANANNNGNGWDYIKFGRKNNTSVGTITTASAIDKAVTKVVLTIDALTASKINSITLYTKTSSGSYDSAGTFTKATGTQTVTLANPTANLFYKIEVDCARGSSNGLIQISRVDYYADLSPTATYDVSWVVNGEEVEVTEGVNEGTKVSTLPDNPEIDCSGKTFVGWSNKEVTDGNKPAVLFTDAANSPTITNHTTFYAVFAESGGSSVTTWPETDISGINDGDEVVVVMNNSVNNYALNNSNGTSSAPTATLITVSDNCIKTPADEVKWFIGKSDNNLTFYKDSNKDTWLYCTSTNNGVRVGTNTNKTFTIDATSGYLKHTGTSRYVGIYNSQDWRCYTGTSGTNIANQTLAFYKKTTTGGYQNYTTECTTAQTYTVAIANDLQNGTVTASPTTASEGDEITLTPAPANGFKFSDWNVTRDDNSQAVSVTNNKFSMPASNVTVSATFVAIPKLATPTNLNATNITTTTATLTWDWSDNENSTYLNGYNLYYKKVGDANFTGPLTCNTNSSNRTGLTPNTEYVFKVAATSNNTAECKSSEQSAEFTFKTKELTKLATPTNLKVTNISCTGATLSWDKVDNATGYTLWLKLPTGTTTKSELSADKLTASPTLSAGNTYSWTLQAKGDGTNYTNSEVADGGSFTTNYKITYDVKGGSWTACEDGCVANGEDFTICSTVPIKTGYNFMGWSTADDATAEYQAGGTINNVSANTTLYAVWEQPKYTVNWYVNGDIKKTQTDIVGTALTDIPEPTTADCDNSKVFVGWTTTDDYSHATDAPTGMITNTSGMTMPEGGEDYYAVFATSSGGSGSVDYSSTHTSNVPINAGTAITNTNVIIESKEYAATKAGTGSASGSVNVTIPAGTTQLSFHMAGWNGEGGKTITLTGATADPSSFKTIADAGVSGNGKYTLSGDVAQYAYSTTLTNITQETKITFANNGADQRFVIWGVNASTGVSYSDYTTTCDNTKATVTYDLNGGTGATCEQTTVTKDEAFNLCSSTPTKNGYTFAGWSDGTKTYDAGAEVTISESTTFYASWKANTITITWNLNYTGCPEAETSTYVYEGDEIEMPEDPIRTGYKFNGWYTESTDGNKVTEVGDENKPSADVTYYAQWLEQYTVTFYASGQVYQTQQYKYTSGDKLVLPETDPSAANFACDGYLFEGWSKYQQTKEDANRPELVDANTSVENDLELHAVWKKASTSGAGTQIFYESFDTENGTGGNDGKWSGDIAKNSKVNTTWTFENEGGAYQCIKLGSSSKQGSATTPALTQLSGDATLSFKAAAWNSNSESTILKLSISGGGTLTQTSVTLVKGAWTTYEVQIKDGTPSSTITFAAAIASNNRFFLDEVMITTSGSYNYTTSPSCGPTMVAKENVWGTSANGQSVKVNVPLGIKLFEGNATITGTSTNENFVVNTLENVGNGEHNLVVVYTPTADDTKENTTITLTAKSGEEVWSTTTFTLNGRSLPNEFVVVANKGDKNYALPANMTQANVYAGLEVEVSGEEVTAAPKSHLYNARAVHSTRFSDNGTALRLVGNNDACLWASNAANGTNIRNWAKLENAKSENYEWNLYTEDGDTYYISSTAVTEEGRVLRLDGTNFGMYKQGVNAFQLLPVGCTSTPMNVQTSTTRTSATISWTNAGECDVEVRQGSTTVKSIPAVASPLVVSDLAESTAYTFTLTPAENASCSAAGSFTTTGPTIDIVEWQTGGIRIYVDKDENVNPKVIINGEEEHGSVGGQVATELFFSKYYEAHAENKLLAVYNGTAGTIDLSGYVIKHGEVEIDLSQYGQTKGSIAPNEEIILVAFDNDASKSAESCAEKEEGFNTWNVLAKELLAFSGRGSVGLYKDDQLIDLIGSVYPSGELTKIGKSGSPDNCGTDEDVRLHVDGLSVNDQSSFFCHNGDNIKTKDVETNYPISTNRCLLIRKNTVTSGETAVTSNKADADAKCGDLSSTFTTLCSEWSGFRIGSGSSSTQEIQDATCEGLGYVGGFDYNNYYRTMETIHTGKTLDQYDRNPNDDTYFIEFDNVSDYSCLNIQLQLTDEDGNVLTDQITQVPILVYGNKTTTNELFSAIVKDGENPDYENSKIRCATCDVVIQSYATLTKAAPGTENDVNQVRDIYVYPGGKLIVPEGANDYNVNSVSLRRDQDEVAAASIQAPLNITSSSNTPVYVDIRINSENWHWMTLPYDCNIADVTWKDGSKAIYNSDWFLMYYDGEQRAATQAGGHWYVYEGTTIEAGKGYIVGITGHPTKSGVQYELRFPMAKEVLTKENENKKVDVYAWGVEDNIKATHKGWNLVGNPYLDYYLKDEVNTFGGLRLGGKYEKDDTGHWYDTGMWGGETTNLPYLVVPVNGGWESYDQVLVSETDMKPFTSYFVQVGETTSNHKNGEKLDVIFDASKLRNKPQSIIQRSASEVEEPVIVGVSLTNAQGESDKTSLVIDNQFTDEYEMNADFFKWFGDYYRYYTKPVLYTIGADQGKRAFNALSEDLASQPISLGMFAAKAGNYTFSLDLRSDLSKVQEVWLYDATQDTYTNLLQDSYTFQTAKTESAGRFFLSVKMAPKVSTNLDNLTDGTIWATTQDHTILVNGLLSNAQLWIYDATGKLLHTDQTQYYQHSYSVPVSGTYFVRVQNTMQTQTIKVVVE